MTAACDVAVIGAGPTGLTLANLLGAAGLAVALVERNATTVQEPRAVSIDDEALRTLQAAGLVEEVIEDVALDYGSHYFTAAGVCFAKVEPTTREYGYPRRNAFTQPRLEATLARGLRRFPNVSLLLQNTCGSLQQEGDGVTLALSGPDGETKLRAAYVVGCDGARSGVRRAIGARLEGATYEQRWLIVDLAATSERLRQTRVICDPARPVITLPGPHGIRRYEFMLRDEESDEEASSPAFARALLAGHGPDADAPVVRRQVYTFHARVADRWGNGRVFLAGDAAHLSPPFAGQGMNSGIRDAHNLAWKLAAVVRGGLGPRLLETYEQERGPHARALIQLAINIGRVMMPTSRAQAALVQSGLRAARLVPAVHGYLAQMRYKPKPFYREGFLTQSDPFGAVGRMAPQPTLEMLDGKRVPLDQITGNGFGLVAYGPDAQRTLLAARDLDLGLADVRQLAVLPARTNPDRALGPKMPVGRDVDDLLARVLPADRETLMVVRPDRYVAAAADASDAAGLDRLAAAVRALVARTWDSVAPSRAAPIHPPQEVAA